jgi:hypothetical protein
VKEEVLDILNNAFDNRIWRLRHESHWTIRRIARWLGVSAGTVCTRLAYLERRHGIRRARTPKRRRIRLASLSTVFNA